MGLMKIQQPEITLPAMVAKMEAESNVTKRQTLFGSLLALLSDKELLEEPDILQKVFVAAIQANDIETFQATLSELSPVR